MMASSSKENVTGAKRQKTSTYESIGSINKKYFEEKCMENISASFLEKKSLCLDSEAYVLNDPFFCTVMGNFIESSEYVQTLKKEVDNLKMKPKQNDLYKFKQSDDLWQCKNPCISNFVKLLYEDLLKWMQEVTKIPLNAKVDISAACYSHTDHLLCHDDQLEDRRIAFIYYLTSDWSSDDGGSLDLFTEVNGDPGEIKESIIPELNKFVFFEVSPVSFHQVAEVKTEKKRLAISGWFHGPPLQPSVPLEETMLFTSVSTLPVDIHDWINPKYLTQWNQWDIRQSFEANSEIELSNFLQTEKYEEVCRVLQDTEIIWEKKGPRTRRYYLTLNVETSPAILQECQALFCSEAFFLVLTNLTGVTLHPACKQKNASLGKVCSSVRKWQNQCYTLLHDEIWNQGEALHAMMFFNCSEWDSDSGGFTSYVCDDDEEPLLLIDPKPNSLSLVFITEGTASFVKYVNCNAKESSFNDIFNVYIENK